MLPEVCLDRSLSSTERRIMARLTTPSRIQSFLDGLSYSTETAYRCPLRVLRERVAHCFDGRSLRRQRCGIFAIPLSFST